MPDDALRRAKRRTLEALDGEPWFMGLGVTRKDSKPALIVSVRKSKRSQAERVLKPLKLRVPVVVREVGRIRALPAAARSHEPSRGEIEALKKAAQRRSGA